MTSLEPGLTPLIPRFTESIVAHFLIVVLKRYDFSTTSYTTTGLSTYLWFYYRSPLTQWPPPSLSTAASCSSTYPRPLVLSTRYCYTVDSPQLTPHINQLTPQPPVSVLWNQWHRSQDFEIRGERRLSCVLVLIEGRPNLDTRVEGTPTRQYSFLKTTQCT